jgi:hypothetical protein
MKYHPLPVRCSLCEVSLEDCAARLAPAFVYTLTVHPTQLVWTRQLLKKMGAAVQDNPFAPYVNVLTDVTLERGEWHLSDGNAAVGTLGV